MCRPPTCGALTEETPSCEAVVSLRAMQLRDYTPFARTNHRGDNTTFGIFDRDRLHHIYMIGKSGTGKTTLLRNLVLSDIHSGRGCALIDPHGDLVEDLLHFIPRRRLEGRGPHETIYFDAGDTAHPVGFNLLGGVPEERRPLLASSVVESFKSIWGASWGPRTEYLLYNSVAALLDSPGTTLLGIPRLLDDPAYRRRVAARIADPFVRNFWEREFAGYSESFRREAIAPVQNKIGRLLSNPTLRNILGQPKSRIDLRRVMDEGKVLLVNLSKGRVGSDVSNFLGSLIVAGLGHAAFSRADAPADDRLPFYLHIDEFQNFTTDSFAPLLSEARKFGLSLTVAHQFIDQLAPTARAAIFGNVGTIVCFRIGEHDAEVLAREFHPVFTGEDLSNLQRHQIALRLMIEGQVSRAFSATTLPPLAHWGARPGQVIDQSRRRYAMKAQRVSVRIDRWFRAS